MRKTQLVILFALLTQAASSQVWNVAMDTIEVKARNIVKLPRFAVVDSAYFVHYGNADLAQLVQISGIGTANKYGGGGAIASVRNAGMKPEFIAVEWNGMAINSLSLGMADISLIPSFFIDQVSFNESNFEWGQRNTGIGGNLKLSSSFSSKPSLVVQSSYSSLLNGFLGVKLKQQRGKNRYDFRVLSNFNRNEFYYVDPFTFVPNTVIQKNNDTHIQGIQAGIQHSALKGIVESRFLLVKRNAELPDALGGLAPLNAQQQDRIFKWSTSFKPRKGFEVFGLEGMKEFALLVSNDYNNYQNKTSKSIVESSQLGGNVAIYLRGAKGFLQNQTNLALSDVHYSEWNARYNWMHASSYFAWVQRAKWGEYLLWFKPEYRTDQNFISSFEAALQIPSSQSWKWKWSASRLARFPTANELYWQPGGNPYLKPEVGSWIKSALTKSWRKWQVDADSKYGMISNWIQWSPINAQVWSPLNIKSVRLWQSSVGLSFQHKTTTSQFKVNASIQFTSAIGKNKTSTTSFQMVYTPKWKGHAHVEWNKKNWNFLISCNQWSARYTDEANTPYFSLPAMVVVDAAASKVIHLDSNHMDLYLGVAIDNIGNQNYQWVRGYITPGSVYTIQVKLIFK